jgi:hypothetical protein
MNDEQGIFVHGLLTMIMARVVPLAHSNESFLIDSGCYDQH